MSNSEICGFPKADGTPCKNKATNSVEGHTKKFCGVHKAKAATQLGSVVVQTETKPSSKSTGGAVASVAAVDPTEVPSFSTLLSLKLTKANKEKRNPAAESVYNDIVKIINTTDCTSWLSPADKDIILNSVSSCPPQVFNLIISGAFIDSGSTNKHADYNLVAKEIPEKYSGFLEARNLREVPISTYISFYPPRENSKICPIPEKLIFGDYEDKKICMTFIKTNITILNVKRINLLYLFGDYSDHSNLNFEQKQSIENFRSNGAIYMGPPMTDSEKLIMSECPGADKSAEYFIPRNGQFLTREEQNTHDVERIMQRIKNGDEKPEKYTSLKNKTLCCKCLPDACHCEVYVKVIELIENL